MKLFKNYILDSLIYVIIYSNIYFVLSNAFYQGYRGELYQRYEVEITWLLVLTLGYILKLNIRAFYLSFFSFCFYDYFINIYNKDFLGDFPITNDNFYILSFALISRAFIFSSPIILNFYTKKIKVPNKYSNLLYLVFSIFFYIFIGETDKSIYKTLYTCLFILWLGLTLDIKHKLISIVFFNYFLFGLVVYLSKIDIYNIIVSGLIVNILILISLFFSKSKSIKRSSKKL